MSNDISSLIQALSTRDQGHQAEQREPAKYWVNVGFTSDAVDPATGEVEEVFVSTPVGIPIDRQQPVKVTSSSPKMAALQQAKNDLLDELLTIAEGLGDGEEVKLNLEVRLRRAGTPNTNTSTIPKLKPRKPLLKG